MTKSSVQYHSSKQYSDLFLMIFNLFEEWLFNRFMSFYTKYPHVQTSSMFCIVLVFYLLENILFKHQSLMQPRFDPDCSTYVLKSFTINDIGL